MADTDTNSNLAAWSNFRQQIKEHKTWFVVMGICLILLGVITIAFPLMSSISIKLVIGWIVLFAGIMQIVYAFQTKTWSGFFIDLLVGLAYIIVGGWLSFFPLTGLITLTAIIGILFFIEGGFRGYMALQMRPTKGWGWVMFSSVTGIVAGILILAGLPSSAAWVLGLLVGINLITSGWALVFLANAASNVMDTLVDSVETVAKEMKNDNKA